MNNKIKSKKLSGKTKMSAILIAIFFGIFA